MGNGWTQVPTTAAGFACKTDSDCFVAYEDENGIKLPAASIADQSKRCCQFTGLSKQGVGSDAKFISAKANKDFGWPNSEGKYTMICQSNYPEFMSSKEIGGPD